MGVESGGSGRAGEGREGDLGLVYKMKTFLNKKKKRKLV